MIQMVGVLPRMAAKAAEPLSAIDRLAVISTDGAKWLSRTAAENIAQGMEPLSSPTGVDLPPLLKSLTASTSATSPEPVPANGKIASSD
ncbi:hypothetical protein ACWGIU_08055 [Streptomyces sp. NPDC054840]